VTLTPDAPEAPAEVFPLSDTLPEHEPDPMRTLGWGVILWAHTWLVQPDGDHAGEPWRFTDAQIHFLLWYYAIDDDGRFLHNRAAIRRSKGTGKSPYVAALSLCELVGPVRFAGFDSTDDSAGFEFLVGKSVPMPWVQIAATAEAQTTNTMSMVTALVPPGSRVRERYGLDTGKTRVYTPGGGRLEIITASPHAAEGARPTFCVLDETEWWLASNGGHDLAKVIRRNLGKIGGRSIETCNAFVPGQDSVAEATHGAYVAQTEGRTVRRSLLYDSLEAPADTDPRDPESLRRGLRRAYSGAPWVDIERIVVEYLDPGTPPEMAARFYLNHIISGEDAWMDLQTWHACGRKARRDRGEDEPAPLADGDLVTLGFDGSIRDDATALVAARISDGYLELIGCWERPPYAKDWQVDRVAVDAAFTRAMETYDVAAVYADPAHWQDYLDRWQAEWGDAMRLKASGSRPMEWWTGGGHSRRMVTALERFHEAAQDVALSHADQPTLTRHIGNARVRPTRSGDLIGKPFPQSPDKIDACMAAVLAYEARCDAVAAGITEDQVFVPIRVY
jgi:hypothetical protein